MGTCRIIVLLAASALASGCALVLGLDDYGDTGGGAAGSGVGGVGGALDTTSVGAGGSAATSYRDLVLSHTPVGYWRLGEPAGCPSPCVAVAETGPHGNYQNGYTLGEEGAVADDTSVRLDDVSNGHVSMGDAFNFPTMAPFSVEAWVKPAPSMLPPSCLGGGIVTREMDDPSCDLGSWSGYSLRVSVSCVVHFELTDCAGGVTLDALSTTVMDRSRWYHVVGSYDGDTASIYVDGVREDFDDAVKPSLAANDGALFVIGMRSSASFGNYLGWIDEVAVYDYALQLDEIGEHFLTATLP